MKANNRKTDKLGRRQYSKSERRGLVQKFMKSGMSQTAFCEAHGLMCTTFSGWRQRMRSRKTPEAPVTFAEVELPAAASQGIDAEVIYPDGRILRLRNVPADSAHASFIREVVSC
jgi:transposase-like protein